MKIKLDENLPTRLGALLESLGHLVDTVADEGLTGRPDTDVWIAAQKEGRFLITQDNSPEFWAGCFVVLTEHKLRVKRP